MTTKQAPIHSGFGELTTAREVVGKLDLSGAVAIVTGGHAGIGLETTRALAGAGTTVIVGARTLGKAQAALAGIARFEVEALDLSIRPRSTRSQRDSSNPAAPSTCS